MKIAVGSKNPVKIEAIRRAFSRFFKVNVTGTKVDSGVSSQPIGFEETMKGAENRARKAKSQGDLGVGIEAGLIRIEGSKRLYFDIQITAIYDGNFMTYGLGPGFVHPPSVVKAVQEGRDVGELMEELSGVESIGKKLGAIGFLTDGKVTRIEISEMSVLMALVPRIKSNLYSSE
ncbi:non-canonical purine NTP phosphatase [archaeon BMS3Bbin15]|nr:non-canonical purine NTP phosphatase [archaeon BMS3Bbin15]